MNTVMLPLDPIALVAILAGALVLTAAIVAVTIIILVKGRQESGASNDEVRLAQELERGFQQMQRRVETLETLLLERERKDQR